MTVTFRYMKILREIDGYLGDVHIKEVAFPEGGVDIPVVCKMLECASLQEWEGNPFYGNVTGPELRDGPLEDGKIYHVCRLIPIQHQGPFISDLKSLSLTDDLTEFYGKGYSVMKRSKEIQKPLLII